MGQTSELVNFIQDYFRETLTNFLSCTPGEWFLSFVNNKNAAFVFDLNANEKDYLIRQIKANIGRNLWGNEIFYSILLQEDRFLERAIISF
jgi:hypothetical protein